MAETRLPPYTPAQERWASLVVKWMTIANKFVYRLTDGRLGGKFMRGAPVCLVTTIGRKSAEPRTVALLYLEDGEDVILVASKGGMSHHPQWHLNLEAHPHSEVQIGSVKRKMLARRASDEEKAALWPRLTQMYPDFDDYQARTTRNIPVWRLSPR